MQNVSVPQRVILVAKSDCTRDDTHDPPTVTRGHDPDNDFATNIRNSVDQPRDLDESERRPALTKGGASLAALPLPWCSRNLLVPFGNWQLATGN